MLHASIDPVWQSRGADSDYSDGGRELPDGDVFVPGSIRVLSEEQCCFSARVSPPRGGHIISESNKYLREGELVRVEIEGQSYFAQNVGTELLGYAARMDLQVELGPFVQVPSFGRA